MGHDGADAPQRRPAPPVEDAPVYGVEDVCVCHASYQIGTADHW